jgi:hypothetical protein
VSEFANQGPLYLFSTEHMPAAPRPEPDAFCNWHGSDSEKRYRKQPHPVLGPGDVKYNFNTLGYRCREFDLACGPDAPIRVAMLGASEILGTGVPQDQTVSAVFARLLGERLGRPAIDWNLGIGGSSPDYIARMLVSVLPVLRPDVMLMSFPYHARREHIDADGRISYFNTGRAGQRKLAERFLEPDKFALMQASMTLSSEYNDALSLYKNYQVCEALCEKHRTMWLFSATRDVFFEQIAHLVAHPHWVRPGLSDLKASFSDDPAAGLARDMQHPGVGPHRDMAALFLAQLEACYPERLRLLERAAVAA